MKADWKRTAEKNRTARPLLLVLVLSLCLFVPRLSLGADLEVWFDAITLVGGHGPEGRDFLPGDEMQVRVQLRVLQATGNPFYVRLRIAGDGWQEMLPPSDGVGREITYAGLRVPTTAGEGKVSLLMDVFSTQDTVALHGRRHAYLTIQCPGPRLKVSENRPQVGASPRDMALTDDGRFLYVTSEEEPRVTVIDVEEKAVVPTDLEDSDTIEFPAGVAASPSGSEMLIVDAAFPMIHEIDANTHELLNSVSLIGDGQLENASLGDLVVSPDLNEAYITDALNQRIVVFDLTLGEVVRTLSLVGFPPFGLAPVQVMPDPDNSRILFVLCQGFNEVIKLDVISGAILDFVQLVDVSDPNTLWPAWSMTARADEIYVVVNPGELDLSDLLTVRSKIIVLPKNWLWGPGRREILLEGSSIWELVVREDGLVYAIDSYRGEILLLDLATETEMSRCAIPVEPGGRLLRADRGQNRLFVGGWLAGFVNIVE